jgi:carbon starvation protein
MNSALIMIVALLLFTLGYIYYGKKLEQLWGINPQRPTPANSKYDGIDYVPAKNWFILFGHHFSSIAGAGPIIGPALALTLWGWFPTLLWIIFGSIFAGGIHDFGALVTSVREEGNSISDIAARAISPKAKIVLSIFTWLALVLVIAVFAYFGADTFKTQPEIVLPSLGIIPVAVIVGLALYKYKLNTIGTTLGGLAAFAVLFLLGERFPVVIPNALQVWIVVLLIYCFFASVIPVHYLLQPRDYLSSYLLIAWIVLAVAGILVSHPEMNAPAFITNKSSLGYLWPMMFITVACGANSGFHALISSGTTSKQLPNERYARPIGYGAMLVEGFVAVLVVLLICGGLTRKEFHSHIAQNTTPVNLFGVGFGNVTAPFLGKWGTFIALTALNAFILTTLDTAARIARYITEELFRIKNRFLSTAVIIGLGGWLGLGRDNANHPLWQKIWPAFGASNQLVAALALFVIACWLLTQNRPARYALIPAFFMLLTSLTALVFQIVQYVKNQEIVLSVISALLIISAGYVMREVITTFRKLRVNL